MKEVHLICNAHLDPIWQWTEDEGISAAISTFASAVKLAEEFDYIFCHNEVLLYKYISRFAPELFKKIKRLVREGKWHIMGGWFLQPDCNMPSGESFVRQILVGRKYFLENFGVAPTTAINFDPFGHTRGLVQILAKCGQTGYLITRPQNSLLPLPAEQFIWKGYDGSTVAVNRAAAYGTSLGQSAPEILRRAKEQPEDVVCVLWGVGNHGGGPSRKDLADIQELLQNGELQLLHSTPENFFARINPEVIVEQSLLISMPGCYTTMSAIKKKHIELENMLFCVEKMCSVASLKGLMEYPQSELDEATEDLLSSEFHDVLPGSSIQSGEENGLLWLNHGLRILQGLRSAALFALAGEQPPAKEGEYPVLIFNPHPYRYQGEVACEFSLADLNWDPANKAVLRVIDAQGNETEGQLIKEESNLNIDWRKKLVLAADLPPLSLARYSVFITFENKPQPARAEKPAFANADLQVEINPATGLLSRFAYKGTEYLSGGVTPEMYSDNADPWGMSEAQQRQMGETPEPFTLMQTPSGIFEGMQPVQVIEDGPLYLGVEAFLENRSTKIRMEYKIYKSRPAVDIHADVFWNEADQMLKLKFPVAVSGPYIGQTAFGHEELFTNGRECISQRFVAIQGKPCLAILNNCQYGSSCKNGAISLSLLRGATYCAHPIGDRELIPHDRFTKKIDQGWRSFDFRLLVANTQELDRLSLEFIQPPYALNAYPVEAIPGKPFGLHISNPNITLQAFKKGETSPGYILRLQNNSAGPAAGNLTFNGQSLPLAFAPFEVKTLSLTDTLRELPGMAI